MMIKYRFLLSFEVEFSTRTLFIF